MPVFEPKTAALFIHFVKKIPSEQLAVNTAIEAATMTIMCIQNTIGGKNNWKLPENRKYLKQLKADLKEGFERRMIMMMTNKVVLSSPKQLLDKSFLQEALNANSEK